MRYGSVCSGIEAASVAWEPLGWQPAWFSEIDPFACAVLAHHWPEVHNYGDFTTIPADAPGIDLLVGGTPCQSFSVAGLRGGMDDDRGNLALEFCRLVDRTRPRWVVWENVPGVLSSGGGRDFGAILGALGELGYGWAYRVLDAQFFGVPQRRRRVFVVGYLGDWRPPCAVLFERTSLSGHPTPRREAGQDVAGSIGQRLSRSHTELDGHGDIRPMPEPIAIQHAMIGRKPEAGPQGKGWRDDGVAWTLDSRTSADVVAHALTGSQQRLDGPVETYVPMIAAIGLTNRGIATHDVAETVRSGSHGALPMAFNWHRADMAVGDVSPTVAVRDGHSPAVAFDLAQITSAANRTRVAPGLPASTLNGSGAMHVASPMAVRRLTPLECERLQGFSGTHTSIQYRGKHASDGPRYRAIGNSMAVPVMRWIASRIEEVTP